MEPKFVIRVTHASGSIVILDTIYDDEDSAAFDAFKLGVDLDVAGRTHLFTCIDVQQLGTVETLMEMV